MTLPYFIEHLYSTKCFLIWDKKITQTHTFSMVEFAWTSFNSNSKSFYQPPVGERGFYNIDGKRIHPTQKSIDLYQWQLSLYAKPNDKILDTHLGSASIAIAVLKANNLDGTNLTLTGSELDKDYYDASMKRIKDFQSQLTIF